MNTNAVKRLLGGVLTALLPVLAGGAFSAHADTIVKVSSFEYDAAGLLTKEIVEPDSPNDCLQTVYGRDGWGNKTSSTRSACAGASGHAVASASTPRTSSTQFSADGRFPLASANALSQTESRVFDQSLGLMTSLTGPNGLVTAWIHDGFGRKTRETRADGTYTTWSYKLCTDAGASCPGPIAGAASVWVLIEQSFASNNAANGPEKRKFHDKLSRVVRLQTQGFDGSGAAPVLVQDNEYDALGRLVRKSDVYALSGGSPVKTVYTYDALGRLTQDSVPDPAASGGMANTTYGYNGLSSSITNTKNQAKTTTKDAQGKVTQVVDAAGSTTVYTYNAAGNLLSVNAAGLVTTMTYSQRGQKLSMADPAMGAWEYRYNVFDEMVFQRDSLSQTVTMAYDMLGRMTQRNEPDLVSQWSHDKDFAGNACGKSIGQLCEAKSDNGYSRKHQYDVLGRLSSTATVLDNPATPAVESVSYHAVTGRLASRTWPTGYQASYAYSPLGYVKSVTGGGSGGFAQTVGYEITSMDARGNITQYKTGNQVTTVKTYNATTGRLSGQSVTRDGQAVGNVLNHTYAFDALGNLTSRSDNTAGVGTQESFSYDSLNRATLSTFLGGSVSPPRTTEVMYDARGNITYKSDVGRYWYDSARPNRMTNVTLETAPGAQVPLTGTRALSFAFDDSRPGAQSVGAVSMGNGNLEYTVSQDTVNSLHTVRSGGYTSFNMPSTIVYGNFITSTSSTADRTLTFVYGPEHQRIRQTVSLNGTSTYSAGTNWYLNGIDGQGLSYEMEIKANGITEHKHFVSAGGVVFSLFVNRTGSLGGQPATSTSYFNHDHLGSVVAITDEAGAVVERLAYDPWGKRRYIGGTNDVLDAIVGVNTDRGYTMHEHLDEVGIIHMNGRVYDPLVGRFVSADPFIQHPEDLQSHNRYSYVLNNPLALTDPSGYFSFKKFLKKAVRVIAAIAITLYLGPGAETALFSAGTFGGGTAAGVVAAAANGAVAGGISGGIMADSSKGILPGALSGALFGVAGEVAAATGAGSAATYGAHAVAGCASAAASGGECGRGALSAVVGKGITNGAGELGITDPVGKGVATAVAGGVAAEVGGGKFENGATTAAFGYLFNYCATGGDCWAAAQRQIGQLSSAVGNGIKDLMSAVYPGAIVAECALGGCSALGWGVAAIDVAPGGGKLAGKFFEGAVYTDKVIRQMDKANDIHHSFPLLVDGAAAQSGQVTRHLNGDGTMVWRLQAEGSINGTKGTFDYIKDNTGQINHRQFQKATP